MDSINWRDYIVCNPEVLVGKPTIKGTRLSVEFVLGLFAAGWTLKDVLEEYLLTPEQVRAVFAYAHELAGDEVVHALPATS
jgi:uncharacterized protein (DUF433 family)